MADPQAGAEQDIAKDLEGLTDVAKVKELALKFHKDKSDANHEAQKLRETIKAMKEQLKEIDTLRSQLDEVKNKDKGEAEVLKDRLAKLEAKHRDTEQLATRREREVVALKAGATDVDYVTYKLDLALKTNPEADPDALLVAIKKDHPHLFGQKEEKPPKDTGGGGPGLGTGSKGELRGQLEQVEKDIKEAKINRNDPLVLALHRERNRLLRMIEA